MNQSKLSTQEPFQFMAYENFENGKLLKAATFKTDANRILLIKYISAHISVPIGQELSGTAIITTVNSKQVHHYMSLFKSANFEDKLTAYIGGNITHIYADPDTEVALTAWKNSSICPSQNKGDIRITISGYYFSI